MIIQDNIIKPAEKYDVALRSLYSGCGFRQFAMSKFEEYDLYARNKDFLVSDDVITFKDTSGKLMALKPDITLSIVKNGRDIPGEVQKYYYSERVYRISESVHAFREITQTGVECIGFEGEKEITEVVILAAQSMAACSPRYILEIADLDILTGMIRRLGLPEETTPRILDYIKCKNLHDLRSYGKERGALSAAMDDLCLLLEDGTPQEVCRRIERLGCSSTELEKLRRILSAAEKNGLSDRIRLDMSLVSDINYYNGIIFRGFVYGVPSRVLSGGQYDRLMQKMGRSSRAVGFAVYLDELERLRS